MKNSSIFYKGLLFETVVILIYMQNSELADDVHEHIKLALVGYSRLYSE